MHQFQFNNFYFIFIVKVNKLILYNNDILVKPFFFLFSIQIFNIWLIEFISLKQRMKVLKGEGEKR